MTDKAQREVEKARRASQILDSEMFKSAVEAVKDELWREFLISDFSDDDKRRNTRIGVEMLDRVLKALRKHVDTGKLATKSLADLEKKPKPGAAI